MSHLDREHLGQIGVEDLFCPLGLRLQLQLSAPVRPFAGRIGGIELATRGVEIAGIRSEPGHARMSPVSRNVTDASKACNDCHQATNFGFNRVQRPVMNPYPNQVFAPKAQ